MQAFYPAQGADDHIKITLRQAEHDAGCPCCNRVVTLPTPRQNFPEGICKSLCDYISPLGGDHIGLFAATVSQTFIDRLEAIKQQQGVSDYDALLLQTLGDRLVEAASEYLHRQIHWSGIRPAIGYPCLPDQKAIFRLAEMIDFSSIGITLTENGAMYPQASVCGLYIGHPQSEYFPT
jgi:5-methyltetrahydrofolate--homocysteine methyltransferase